MPSRPRSPFRPLWIALAAVAGLGLCAAGAVALWLPSEAELAERAAAEASTRLGVPVTIGRLAWTLLPVPEVVLTDVRTAQDAPLTVGRLTAQARWADLLQRRLALTLLRAEDATVPQRSLAALKPPPAADDAGAGLPLTLAAVPVEHVEWRNLRWVSRRDRTLAYAGEADFDPAWRPRSGRLERQGAQMPARLEITREGSEDAWRARVTAGGRTEDGTLRLTQIGERYRVTGAVDFTGVDVPGLLAAFERRSVVAGKATGHTDVIAEGATLGEAVRAFHTRTRFTIPRAMLLSFDLERAVKTLGQEHRGTTPLDTLAGVVRTESHPGGTIVRYDDLKGTSGVLTATGDAVVQDRRVSGHVAVDLVEGLVGVPLEFGGSIAAPTLTVPPAALAGAAVGTVVAPGVGTALGARIGETLRRLFGGGAPERPGAAKAPARKAPGGPLHPAP